MDVLQSDLQQYVSIVESDGVLFSAFDETKHPPTFLLRFSFLFSGVERRRVTCKYSTAVHLTTVQRYAFKFSTAVHIQVQYSRTARWMRVKRVATFHDRLKS